ncbi:MAG: TonB-dependent receptor [Bacteroidota bacterium]
MLLFWGLSLSVFAQQTIQGEVSDATTSEPLIGASVLIKGTASGTVTDYDGNFEIAISDPLPITVVISYTGYQEKEVTFEKANKKLRISLEESAITVDVVEVKASRVTEKQKEAALTIESLDAIAIKETPAVNFYDGLGALKGVDLTAASIGFKIVNTRGFNSTSPVRSLQLIDGIDNQAPGLNFSIGNFAGASELDVNRVELIVGASSALYGPNAFNGVISMQTKSPFIHKGLSVMLKGGERSLFEGAIRYATTFLDDKFAFKVNLTYLTANDWEANNLAATDQVLDEMATVGVMNPGGYDAVNIYGDERLTNGENNFTDLFGQRNFPGLGIYHRTGYNEPDLVDYDTENLKAAGSVHYKITDDVEALVGINYGSGTTVYQGENRYSLKDLRFAQFKAEIKNPDKFYFQAYRTHENSGNTYDAVFTAFKMLEFAKDDNDWSQDYNAYWIENVRPRVWALPGFPDPNDPEFTQGWFGEDAPNYAIADAVLAEFSDSLQIWHDEARAFADGVGNSPANEPYIVPGSDRWNELFDSITTTNLGAQGGTRFYSRSKLNHVQGAYTFDTDFAKITAGASFRQFLPDSRGTIFSDTADVTITNNAFGAFAGVEKRVFDEKVILTATGRLDKNENFDYLFSPAASVVYKKDENTIFRFSFSSAIRNPTLLDQYLLYDVGRAILIGNLNGFNELVTPESLIDYYADLNKDTLDFFNVAPVRPERVRSVEVGYKASLFNNSVFLDASYYYSWYTDFLGFNLGATLDFDETEFLREVQFYRVSANSTERVTTQGFSVGLNYYYKKLAFTGNYSWNVLNTQTDDEIIPAFNTPEHKFNIGFSGRDMTLFNTWRHVGFSVNYKWVEGYLFEGSPQFTGVIDSYDLLDMQVNWRIPRWHSTIKLGASNILNNLHYEVYGGPLLGRMAYISVLYDFKEK